MRWPSPLVSAAANLQPALPVQATRPARRELASVVRPNAASAACVAAMSRTCGSSRFCHTVSRSSGASAARPRSCAEERRPAGTTTPSQCAPSFCACAPRCAARSLGGGDSSVAKRGRGPKMASTSARNFSWPQRSSRYFSRAVLRSVRSPCAMNTRRMASHSRTTSLGSTATSLARARSRWPVMPPRPRRKRSTPSGVRTMESAMSFVSSSTAMAPPPSRLMLNLRGRPKRSRLLRMWVCNARTRGRVSSHSAGSMPAVGEAVMLRMLSAPVPRGSRPIMPSRSTTSAALWAGIRRICRLARVVQST